MVDTEKYRTGMVQCTSDHFSFFAQDYTFHFMLSEYKPFSHDNNHILESHTDGFIHGLTHDNHQIAIYAGNLKRVVLGCQTLNTDLYLVRVGNCIVNPEESAITFDAIEFHGKNLARVFVPHALSFAAPGGDGQEVLTYKDDQLEYHFEANGIQYTLAVYSTPHRMVGIKGSCLSNEDIYLRLSFSETLTVADLNKHYRMICTLLSIMTFRSRVDFDSVTLLSRNERYAGAYDQEWNVYKKSLPESCKKGSHFCLTFEDLGDSVQKLLEIIFSSEDRKPSYSMGFIPESDADVLRFDGDKIKSICAGLECEIDFCDIKEAEETAAIKALAKEVSNLVKAHRSGPTPLSAKSYEKIFSNIKHWGMALSDNVIELYHKHQIAMGIICGQISTYVTDKDIESFVKYRNDVSHGSYRITDERIIKTAYVLARLVYCCLLARIGLKESQIEKFCKMKIGN